MSVIWFVILLLCYGNGAVVDNISLLMVAVFYVGDCILIKQNGRANDETD